MYTDEHWSLQIYSINKANSLKFPYLCYLTMACSNTILDVL